jgi:uncharacterized membrane protein YciS (DUF1049 family)
MKPNNNKKLLPIVIVVIVIFIIIVNANSKNDDAILTDTDKYVDDYETSTLTSDYSSNNTVDYSSIDTSEDIMEYKSNTTIGQDNALQTAFDYLDYSAFSYSGLIKQLEFEGYSTEDATYAVDNCGADWNKQAALCAQNYLDYSSFSRSGLIDQLEFEGFTSSQAEYGADAVGY